MDQLAVDVLVLFGPVNMMANPPPDIWVDHPAHVGVEVGTPGAEKRPNNGRVF